MLVTGIEFTGNPDERVWVTPQTVYDSIPDDQPLWKQRFVNIVGHSMAPELKTKGEIFGYALNAYAQRHLPQFFYQLTTFYQATHWFLVDSDLRIKEGTLEDDIEAFWEVGATGHFYEGTTNEQAPCYDRYYKMRDTKSYFGRPPFVRKAIPYPAPCVQQFTHFEILERGPGGQGTGNFQWTGRGRDGATTGYCDAGGITVDATTLEVTEGGQIFVSLPDLPLGVPEPPPLVGFVVDYGPPGPPGPPGPRGLPGTPGESQSGADMVTAICALPEETKTELKDCLHFPPEQSYYSLVFAAAPVDVQNAQQIIIEKAPELVLPKTEVVLIEEGAATLEATALETGGWGLLLTLPIALLVGLKLLQEKIKVAACLDRKTKFWREIDMPVWSIGEFSQKEIFQELFNQIAWLLRCCPPCELDSWVIWDTVEGSYATIDAIGYDAVMLKFISDDGPEINSWYDANDIHKYGEFRWIWHDHKPFHLGAAVGRNSTLQFWNSREQVFEAHSGNILGFVIDMEVAKRYEIWIRKTDLEPEGLPL